MMAVRREKWSSDRRCRKLPDMESYEERDEGSGDIRR